MFNHNFRSGTGRPEMSDPTEKRDVQAAIDKAYQDGLIAGQNVARSEHDAMLAEAQASIATQMAEINRKLEQDIRQIEDRAGRLALHFARSLTIKMIEQHPTKLVEAAFTQCLNLAGQTPNLTINTSHDIADHLRENLKQKALESGYRGEIQVIQNSALTGSAVTIEWTDGGLNFDPARISAAVEELAQNYFQSQSNA